MKKKPAAATPVNLKRPAAKKDLKRPAASSSAAASKKASKEARDCL